MSRYFKGKTVFSKEKSVLPSYALIFIVVTVIRTIVILSRKKINGVILVKTYGTDVSVHFVVIVVIDTAFAVFYLLFRLFFHNKIPFFKNLLTNRYLGAIIQALAQINENLIRGAEVLFG